MITTLVIVIASFFSGYALMPKPAPEQILIPHNVMVEVPCKAPTIEKPVMPLTDTGLVSDNIYIKSQKALAEIDLRKGYEVKLEAAVESCQ